MAQCNSFAKRFAGQAYLAAYTDKRGAWLDGGRNYRLRVPANLPAKNFWSATVYDIGTRCLIDNKQGRGDRGSRDALTLRSAPALLRQELEDA